MWWRRRSRKGCRLLTHDSRVGVEDRTSTEGAARSGGRAYKLNHKYLNQTVHVLCNPRLSAVICNPYPFVCTCYLSSQRCALFEA